MSDTINVLDIDMKGCAAKVAMKKTVEYMNSDPVSVVEMVSAEELVRISEDEQLKSQVSDFDLVLAGDKTILEAAEISDKKVLQDVENHTFLKMFLRYLHKNHKRVYLLVESEEEGQDLFEYLQEEYPGTQVIGLAKVSAENRADDMVVNAINGSESDCVLAAMSSPLQQEFITDNRNYLNTHIWLGLGKESLPIEKEEHSWSKLTQFFMKKRIKGKLKN